MSGGGGWSRRTCHRRVPAWPAPLVRGVFGFLLTGATAITGNTQQPAPLAVGPSLLLDGVTVIDVVQGARLPDRRVVIAGNHIQRVGAAGAVPVPAGAQVIDARGKYLIPGLWDLHVHPARATDVAYPLFLAHGVTGIRDAGSPVPLDTLRLWRREILAGTRVGPPRQLLSGQSITGPVAECRRGDPERRTSNQTCVADSADAVHYVDSLQAAGADWIKPREVTTQALYAAIAAEARRVGMPFGGHVSAETELEASDYGAAIIDHTWGDANCAYEEERVPLGAAAAGLTDSGPSGPTPDAVQQMLREYGVSGGWKSNGQDPNDPAVQACWRAANARFRRNGTWFVPTGAGALENFRFGLPLLAGTDAPMIGHEWGVSLHEELARYVAQGLTPLEALQTATLNPALMLHATDSLGTVAVGKLADLLLLDADPLADIANTTTIQAVVANGRYFDRATIDRLRAQAGERSTKAP